MFTSGIFFVKKRNCINQGAINHQLHCDWSPKKSALVQLTIIVPRQKNLPCFSWDACIFCYSIFFSRYMRYFNFVHIRQKIQWNIYNVLSLHGIQSLLKRSYTTNLDTHTHSWHASPLDCDPSAALDQLHCYICLPRTYNNYAWTKKISYGWLHVSCLLFCYLTESLFLDMSTN